MKIVPISISIVRIIKIEQVDFHTESSYKSKKFSIEAPPLKVRARKLPQDINLLQEF